MKGNEDEDVETRSHYGFVKDMSFYFSPVLSPFLCLSIYLSLCEKKGREKKRRE